MLVPMIASLPDGGRADEILVDVGPGSFTGIRVGVAAARGLALGWGARSRGYSSLALLAGALFTERDGPDRIAVVIEGGHGEVFVQQFARHPALAPLTPIASLKPDVALAQLGDVPVIGNGVSRLSGLPDSRNLGGALPDSRFALALPEELRSLPPRPFYGRAPDAKPQAAR
jgi:tRNA threonylcarbamoyladenosine biosynthesis protein TsaB